MNNCNINGNLEWEYKKVFKNCVIASDEPKYNSNGVHGKFKIHSNSSIRFDSVENHYARVAECIDDEGGDISTLFKGKWVSLNSKNLMNFDELKFNAIKERKRLPF